MQPESPPVGMDRRRKRRELLVVYVEDDHVNQHVLKTMLDPVGEINLLLAEDEQELQELLEQCDRIPDVVLMDCELKSTTGQQVCTLAPRCSRFLT